MNYISKLLFVVITLSLMVFFVIEGYQSNSSLAKTEEIREVIKVGFNAGSFFIMPLIIGVVFSLALAINRLPWLLLMALCVGATLQGVLFNNFLYILVWPLNVGLSWAFAATCFVKFIIRNDAAKILKLDDNI